MVTERGAQPARFKSKWPDDLGTAGDLADRVTMRRKRAGNAPATAPSTRAASLLPGAGPPTHAWRSSHGRTVSEARPASPTTEEQWEGRVNSMQ